MASLNPQVFRVAGMRRVHARKTLPCTFPNCSKMFSAQSGLTQHILRKHQAPVEPPSSPPSPPRNTQVPDFPQGNPISPQVDPEIEGDNIGFFANDAQDWDIDFPFDNITPVSSINGDVGSGR